MYKANFCPVTGNEGREREKRYSSTLYLTSVLDGMGGQRRAPAALPSREKDPVPIVQEAVWVPGPVWTAAENLAPPGIRSPGPSIA